MIPRESDTRGGRSPAGFWGVRGGRSPAGFWGSAGGGAPRVLLDVGDGHDGGRLREGFGLVLGADALDVVAAALGEARSRLHAALGDEDAQVGAVELEVARAVDAH